MTSIMKAPSPKIVILKADVALEFFRIIPYCFNKDGP